MKNFEICLEYNDNLVSSIEKKIKKEIVKLEKE